MLSPTAKRQREPRVKNFDVQGQTAVTAYLKSKQLLLFVFALPSRSQKSLSSTGWRSAHGWPERTVCSILSASSSHFAVAVPSSAGGCVWLGNVTAAGRGDSWLVELSLAHAPSTPHPWPGPEPGPRSSHLPQCATKLRWQCSPILRHNIPGQLALNDVGDCRLINKSRGICDVSDLQAVHLIVPLLVRCWFKYNHLYLGHHWYNITDSIEATFVPHLLQKFITLHIMLLLATRRRLHNDGFQ